MQPLLDRYPGSNRAGCAALYTGRGLSGAPREAWLQYAAKEGRDCYFLDGTCVGGLARILLAADRAAGGDTAGRDRLLTEVRTEFAGGIAFDGTPLTELADRITNPNQPLQPP